ncbi:serine/threonine-protein kinase [Actinoplanes teichomyceticus]|uniref:non-specific serine/threonine protein kinase n=1 Tax=Actinoplanes teichomyceticus TaxID=1867 RepID=A0A561VH15_ACTTI|nr:serine/threonine-protein kinase [Actinoplanes teichomyceticus]TWG10901.1 serine/threonine protein kinase [Actinoplanes teichomyceticus]GIF12476.1 hypothetical protein Ate01nite_25080 [Actinoplanes teichomyceticus]
MFKTGAVIDGRFVLERQVGAGNSGLVFAAFDRRRRATVALKVQPPRTFDSTDDFQYASERLLADLKWIEQLKGVRGIPSIHEEGRFAGRSYLVMDLVEGVSLATLIDKIKPVHTQLAVSVLAQLCDVLTQVHNRGLVHCDVKPDNITVDWSGAVWLLDLGSVKQNGEQIDEPIGTPGYAPPENHTLTSPTSRFDIYSLGATIFEMCIMRLPYQNHEGPPKADIAQFPSDLQINMNETLLGIGLDMVAFDPVRRPASASVVRAAIETLLPTLGEPRHPRAPDPDPAEWYRHGCHLTHRGS